MAWYVNFSREAPTSRRCPSKKLPRSWICSITDPESASDLPPLLKCCTSLDNSPQRKSGSPAGVGGAPGALRPEVASEAPPQRVRSTGLPLVGGPGLDWRRLAPARWVPARSRAGIQAFSRESPDAKSRGGGPPPPLFLWPARSHSLVLGLGDALFRLCAYFEPHVRALIWGLPFAKFFFSIFFLENAFQIGLSIPDVTAPLSYQRQRSPKRANESERAIKTRVQGGALVFFPPTFFKESRAPPRSSAGNPRCRVHPATVPTEPPTDDRGSRPMGGFTPPPGSTAPG